jgi:hypothetical protein
VRDEDAFPFRAPEANPLVDAVEEQVEDFKLRQVTTPSGIELRMELLVRTGD